MPQRLSQHEPERGGVYRDIDGQIVRVLEVKHNLCTWVPVAADEPARQVTHRDNFVRRFKPLDYSNHKLAA